MVRSSQIKYLDSTCEKNQVMSGFEGILCQFPNWRTPKSVNFIPESHSPLP